MTEFICRLFRMSVEDRARFPVDKAAAKYGIPEEWVRYWLDQAIRSGEQWPVKG